MYDWEKPLTVLMKKVYNYASLHSNVDDICTATALVDLCRDRDNHRYDVFTHSDINLYYTNALQLLVCILYIHFIIFAFVLSSYV